MPRSQFARMLVKFCQQRASAVLSADDVGSLQSYLLHLLDARYPAPKGHRDYDWDSIAIASGIELRRLREAARTLAPGLDALGREVAKFGQPKKQKSPLSSWRKLEADSPARPSRWGLNDGNLQPTQKPGAKPKPIIDFPEPDGQAWTDPASFAEALDLHMRRHGDSAQHLAKALSATARHIDVQTIIVWRRGLKVPSTSRSLEGLELIEKRYRLPPGYFRAKLPITDRCISVGAIDGIGRAERRRLAWHLPADFDRRPRDERKEILEWVKRVVISGSTEYRRFQAAAMRQRYAVRFPGVLGEPVRPRDAYRFCRDEDGALPDPDLASAAVDAPRQLSAEMADLISFKTSTLTAFGFQRNGVWGEETASQKVEHLGLMFGALHAAPSGAVHGFGVPLESLNFGVLVFPIVWDWYIQWRERRRGFYTAWEVDMLRIAIAITRADTGCDVAPPG